MNLPVKKIKTPVEILIFILILILLLFWYALSFTLHLISPPSDIMSREMEISSLDYGFSKILNRHVITLPQEERGLVTVLAVDGEELQIIDIDITGKTRQWKTIDLDLSQASNIEAVYTGDNRIRILYLTLALYEAEIHLEDGRCSVEKIEEGVAGFDMAGPFAVLNKGSSYKILNTQSGREVLIPASGEIQSFCAGLGNGNLEILSVEKRNWETVAITLNEMDTASGKVTQYSVYNSVTSKFYKELADVRILGNELTALYRYRDRRYGVNRMTIQKIDLGGKKIIKEEKYSVPLFNSSFTLVESLPGTTGFIHQFDNGGGVNLAMAVVDEDGVLTEKALTKTKSMSKLAGYFTLGGFHGIVFSDINFDKRALLFASDQPQVMKDRSRFSTLPFWYPASTTLLIFLVSVIAGGLFLLGEVPLPAGTAFLLDRFSKAVHRPLYLVKTGFITVIHTVIKVILTRVLLMSGQNIRFRPLLFGTPPAFYTALVLSALLCSFLALRLNRKQKANLNECMSFYYRFSIMDYLLYVPLMIMYLISSILLSKI